MIIPIGHENLRGRRWPWVTTAIVAICTLVFLATNSSMQRQLAQTGRIELHILVLGALYPDAPMSSQASEFVEAFKFEHPQTYVQLASPTRTHYADNWDRRIHSKNFTADDANAQMAELCTEFAAAQASSIAWNYAFHPVHPFLKTYITATFLHGGWLHLIFNMWFLWLAGTILEDLWGRVVYPIFFLAAGALAWAVHGAVYPHSFVPALGASGAIAGLMGAFLTRFPKTRIRLGWFLLVRFVKFNVPAYIILPAWLFIQVFWGVLARALGAEAGIAYWAHIGGFALGALGALLLRAMGVEHSANKAIEAKVSWTADPAIVRATDSIAGDQPEDAISALKPLVKEKPDSIDAWDLLLLAQEKTGDVEGQKETLAELCRLHVLAGELDAAAADYETYRNLEGRALPRAIWMELCRHYENMQSWNAAVEEYEKLAQTYPASRAGVSALVSAGRICLTNLNSLERAEKFFRAAQASPGPHSDLDASIDDYLKKCIRVPVSAGRYTG
ncbi:MAG: rhomboid family intramembrane serine protease [Candidatus Acidiferrales bacterium]